MATITVTPNSPGQGGFEATGSVRMVTGTWSATGTYTTGGDTFTVPGLTTLLACVVNISTPIAGSVTDASIVSPQTAPKLKLVTATAEAGAIATAGLAGSFIAFGK